MAQSPRKSSLTSPPNRLKLKKETGIDNLKAYQKPSENNTRGLSKGGKHLPIYLFELQDPLFILEFNIFGREVKLLLTYAVLALQQTKAISSTLLPSKRQAF